MLSNSIEENIRKLPTETLINIIEKNFRDYTEEALHYAQDELKKRDVNIQIWFYRKGKEQFGPVTRDDIISLAKEGRLNPGDYVWKRGLDNWVKAENINGLFNVESTAPRVTVNDPNIPPPFKDDNVQENNSKPSAPAGIVIAGILFFIDSGIWGFITIFQFFMALSTASSSTLLLAGWNLVMTLIAIFIGIAVIKLEKWGYDWGIGTSALNTILNIIQSISGGFLLFFLIPINIAIFILLLSSKRYFNNRKEKESVNL